MPISDYYPIWDKLTDAERAVLTRAAVRREVPRGTPLGGSGDCVGLIVVRSGQLRAYILSDEGKEVTLYRLLARDICLFSASCIMNSLQFNITIEAERDSELFIIPPDVYKRLMESSAAVANYTNEIMASRFAEVVWLIEQVMWHSVDRRIAAFLLEESVLEDSDTLPITHDRIAAHLGTAREVVTRMLRYFQSEGMVALSRGAVTLTDRAGLQRLAD